MDTVNLDFDYFDKNFLVHYDELKGQTTIWSIEESPNKNHRYGLWKGDFGYIPVSMAYPRIKENHYHFHPTGFKKRTYLAAYDLNETFGHCTDDMIALYFAGKRFGKKLDYVDSIGDVVDATLSGTNREIKLANYLLGYLNDDDIVDSDSYTMDRNDILDVLGRTKDKIARMD